MLVGSALAGRYFRLLAFAADIEANRTGSGSLSNASATTVVVTVAQESEGVRFMGHWEVWRGRAQSRPRVFMNDRLNAGSPLMSEEV